MKKSFLSLVFIILPVFLSAQNSLYGVAAEIENILDVSAVTCNQAAMFVLNSKGIEFEDGAFEYAVSRGWLKNTKADERITMGQLSFLLMKSFNLKGGILYAIFPGPRYAYRSMVSRSFIQDVSDPAMTVSGERFLFILGKVLSADSAAEPPAQGFEL